MFKSVIALINEELKEQMDETEANTDAVDMDEMAAGGREASRQLYYLQTMQTRKRANKIVRNLKDSSNSSDIKTASLLNSPNFIANCGIKVDGFFVEL